MTTTEPAHQDERSAETPEERIARLRALAAEGAERFAALEAELGPEELADAAARWAAETFGDSLTVACSMADAVLPHVVAAHRPGVDVLFLDTGYHFPETLATRDRVARELDVTVVDVLPERTVAEQDAEHGAKLHDRDPASCCGMRKVAPLKKALGGYDAWVTGVRRDEGPTRAGSPVVTFDEAFGLVKINPLVTWSYDRLMAYSREHSLPENPLLHQGYPSIGCAPCTRPVAPGEDPRAGRWAGTQKTECGLHPGDGGTEAGTAAGSSADTAPAIRTAPVLISLSPTQEDR
ncbi:phosphoadenylyl-sulfate reductase [Brachybacterium sp. J153]|uniref:phosphoadenylyl-sulfate reductase n=1 Tax=Brachybacterium sp. J153 TaxID=3116488 RepID=UPI002E78A1E5|nr:phosphoadenylyl-sulfate reductase [Brachybacterium sp. J153]MEE1617129.1 phosphoadenylyl-sulfate reductase [Brachybacterium sp. J153]